MISRPVTSRENVYFFPPLPDEAPLPERRPSLWRGVRKLSAPWIHDSDAPDCFECHVTFTRLNRRHHCRFCGKVFCAKCTSQRWPVKTGDRACDHCFAAHETRRRTTNVEIEVVSPSTPVTGDWTPPQYQDELHTLAYLARQQLPATQLTGREVYTWLVSRFQQGEEMSKQDAMAHRLARCLLENDLLRDSLLSEELVLQLTDTQRYTFKPLLTQPSSTLNPELNEVYACHLDDMCATAITQLRLSPHWDEPLLATARLLAARRRAADPRDTIKLVLDDRDGVFCEESLLFTSNSSACSAVVHASLPLELERPRVLLVDAALQYERGPSGVVSLESKSAQEEACAVSQVESMMRTEPTVVLCRGAVSRAHLAAFHDHKVVVVSNVKATIFNKCELMFRGAGSARVRAARSADTILLDPPTLALCHAFRARRVATDEGGIKLLVGLHGCDTGGSVVIQGPELDVLRRVKVVLRHLAKVAYHSRLEGAALHDMRIMLRLDDSVLDEVTRSASCACGEPISSEFLQQLPLTRLSPLSAPCTPFAAWTRFREDADSRYFSLPLCEGFHDRLPPILWTSAAKPNLPKPVQLTPPPPLTHLDNVIAHNLLMQYRLTAASRVQVMRPPKVSRQPTLSNGDQSPHVNMLETTRHLVVISTSYVEEGDLLAPCYGPETRQLPVYGPADTSFCLFLERLWEHTCTCGSIAHTQRFVHGARGVEIRVLESRQLSQISQLTRQEGELVVTAHCERCDPTGSTHTPFRVVSDEFQRLPLGAFIQVFLHALPLRGGCGHLALLDSQLLFAIRRAGRTFAAAVSFFGVVQHSLVLPPVQLCEEKDVETVKKKLSSELERWQLVADEGARAGVANSVELAACKDCVAKELSLLSTWASLVPDERRSQATNCRAALVKLQEQICKRFDATPVVEKDEPAPTDDTTLIKRLKRGRARPIYPCSARYLLKCGAVISASEPSSVISYSLGRRTEVRDEIPSTTETPESLTTSLETAHFVPARPALHEQIGAVSLATVELDCRDFVASAGGAADRLKFACMIYYPREFLSLRSVLGIDEGDFAESLSACVTWRSGGGKSGSAFFRTTDHRFILKEMKKIEKDCFSGWCAEYCRYVEATIRRRQPTALTKIVGMYQVAHEHSTPGDRTTTSPARKFYIVVENLFHRFSAKRVYDLKGSQRNRNVSEDSAVLMDDNLRRESLRAPLHVTSASFALLFAALQRDTAFLAAHSVMDYSLLVGVSGSSITVGIIDYCRSFTWDKRLESLSKSFTSNTEPTIKDPKFYRDRFLTAMKTLLLSVPNQWTSCETYVFHEELI